MVKLYPEYLAQDRPYVQGDEMPALDALELVSQGETIYGIILKPEHTPGEKHPLVLLLHGFPGHCTNNDLAHALRRMGCVVFNPYFRGAWGSGGTYTISGLPEDTEAVANWAVSEAVAEKYHIDTDNVFLVGHSMGGFTTINALRRLTWVRAGVCMAPFDPAPVLADPSDAHETLKQILATDSRCLRRESETSIYDDIVKKAPAMSFLSAYEDLKDRNLYFIGGAKDSLAPPSVMIEPLFRKLQAHESAAVRKFDVLDSDHSFDDMRIRLSILVGNYIAALAD